MRLRLALPKGRLLAETASLLQEVGLKLTDYDAGSRSYRPKCAKYPWLFSKVFQEKDIPIQVALGNYDVGICGLDWVEELLVRYPMGDLMKLGNLGYGQGNLYAVCSGSAGVSATGDIDDRFSTVRIVSEYQNLAESFALGLRLKRFSVLPVWGAAEVYPPESADLAVIAEASADRVIAQGLVPLAKILTSRAFLIANRNSLANDDISELLACFQPFAEAEAEAESPLPYVDTSGRKQAPKDDQAVRLALPDGHQQQPAVEFLERAGLKIRGYSGALKTRRLISELPGLVVKVIRPQDMPLQVANENFDLAVTGRDWLRDHLYRFPSSPVEEILDLRFGGVTIVAVVSRDLPVDDANELKGLVKRGRLPVIRVASEYVNIADKYARDRHLERYKVIPTWGASEAFLPEDADLLIENTETGETLNRHNLRVIDTLLASSACLIGNRNTLSQPTKKARMGHVIESMAEAAQGG